MKLNCFFRLERFWTSKPNKKRIKTSQTQELGDIGEGVGAKERSSSDKARDEMKRILGSETYLIIDQYYILH